MIDWDRVAELKSEIGDEAFEEVCAMFLEEMSTALNRFRTGPPPADLKADLHFVKGSAMNLGFADLARLCAQGEASDDQGAAVDLCGIVTCYDQSLAAFQQQS